MTKRKPQDTEITLEELRSGNAVLAAAAACWAHRDRKVTASDIAQARLLREALDKLAELAAAQRKIAESVMRAMFVEAVTQALRQKESGGAPWHEPAGPATDAPKGEGAARAGEDRPQHNPVGWGLHFTWLLHEDPVVDALRSGHAAYTPALGATTVLPLERAVTLAEMAVQLRTKHKRGDKKTTPRRAEVAVALVNEVLGATPPLADLLGRQEEHWRPALTSGANAHFEAMKSRHPTSKKTDSTTTDAAFFGARGVPSGDWERLAVGEFLAGATGCDRKVALAIARADDDWPGKWTLAATGLVAQDAAARAKLALLTAVAARFYGAEKAAEAAENAVPTHVVVLAGKPRKVRAGRK